MNTDEDKVEAEKHIEKLRKELCDKGSEESVIEVAVAGFRLGFASACTKKNRGTSKKVEKMCGMLTNIIGFHSVTIAEDVFADYSKQELKDWCWGRLNMARSYLNVLTEGVSMIREEEVEQAIAEEEAKAQGEENEKEFRNERLAGIAAGRVGE